MFQEEESDFGREALTFALGAVGGLALGMALSRRLAPQQVTRRFGSELRERARTVAHRLRPARLRRMAVEQDELTQLEDAVLDAFLRDEVLSERGIDVGAISPGIVELSGSVWTHQEAEHAVDAAGSIPGVRTVVNRLDVEEEVRHLEESRRRMEEDASGLDTLIHGAGKTQGMGRRRQGRETDPDRPDDSQQMRLDALRVADQDQWEREGLAYRNPRQTERPEVQSAWRTDYDEDELDNQDPHGKHTPNTLDSPPQELNSGARVGEGLKTGEHLRLEKADVPVKPHSGKGSPAGEDELSEDNG